MWLCVIVCDCLPAHVCVTLLELWDVVTCALQEMRRGSESQVGAGSGAASRKAETVARKHRTAKIRIISNISSRMFFLRLLSTLCMFEERRSAKQRALQSLLEMKRSGELQFLAEEMESAQRKFEAKAAQFREISARMRRGVVNAMRSGELERLVGEMTEVLETQAGNAGAGA